MIDFFSKITGIPYPWTEYDQIVARDYVSGAMENTTATLHGEFLYQTNRQLSDDDYQNESVIAHELFHHWFGDLVTCESWSNLTVNESLADFSEMLWAEHAYGKDLADQHSYKAMHQYFNYAKSGKDHPLVDFYYKDPEDIYDYVTYQKGGRVLNMLRNYVGDSAFFHSLHYYLTRHQFGTAESQQLRLAFEHVTGLDLNWFWNQWYYSRGYPRLNIHYVYQDSLHLVQIIVSQTQRGRIFQLPFAIDVYVNGKKQRHQVTMMDRTDTFTYHYTSHPDLINVDGDKVLLAEKKDHKTVANFIYQYRHAGLYMDRFEAIQACAKHQDTSLAARNLLLEALADPFAGIRSVAVKSLDMQDTMVKEVAAPLLRKLMVTDNYSSVRAAALRTLASHAPSAYINDIRHALSDSSLRVEADALKLIYQVNGAEAYHEAQRLKNSAEAPLSQVVCQVLAWRLDSEDFPYIKKNFLEHGSFGKLGFVRPYLHMLANVITDSAEVRNGLDATARFALNIGSRYGVYVVSMLNDFISEKQSRTDSTPDPILKSQLSAQVAYAQKWLRNLQKALTH